MDAQRQTQFSEQDFARKAPGTDQGVQVNALLIRRVENARLYTDEVLSQAGFWVRAVNPAEALHVIAQNGRAYPLVILSNSLYREDISTVTPQVRQFCPRSKLLLLGGPDFAGVDGGLFDAVVEGLDGPAAVIRAARRLTEAAMSELDEIRQA